MRRQEVLVRTKWHNAGGINVIMCDVVVTLDVIEFDGVGNPFLLIQIFEVPKEIRVIHDASDVAFKMSVIDGIESY